MCSPRDSVQRDPILGVDSAQTYDHRLRSRIGDEDPIFLMIYYDNDQFCGVEIYYYLSIE